MPYIKPERRKILDHWMGGRPGFLNEGEINYIICHLVMGYLLLPTEPLSATSYARISAGIAAVTDAADELRRRVLHPYEDAKRVEHGDIFP